VTSKSETVDGAATETLIIKTKTGAIHEYGWTLFTLSQEQLDAYVDDAGLECLDRSQFPSLPLHEGRLEMFLAVKK
jgi:hypothetical protein